MHSLPPSSEAVRPFVTWQKVLEWGQLHYRHRTFNKDQQVPARSGLLYLVQKGAIRLVGTAKIQVNSIPQETESTEDSIEEAFLGFVAAGQPFEILTQSPFTLQAYAHVDQTSIVWMYWHDNYLLVVITPF